MLSRQEIQKGYDAFSTEEYNARINSHALKKDLQSYLAEYRIGVQKHNYELVFSLGADGLRHLSGIDDKESMIVKAKRAVDKRMTKGLNASRESAELKGLLSLDRQMTFAELGDQVVWISPPGSPSEGYGNYAFIFVGTVDKVEKLNRDKRVSMTAIRVENPSMTQFNLLASYLTGEDIHFSVPEEFLAYPKVIAQTTPKAQTIIEDILDLKPNGNDEIFQKMLPLLAGPIEEFAQLAKQNASKETLFKALQSIELYVLDLKKQLTNQGSLNEQMPNDVIPLRLMIDYYKDQKPPTVAGSCGNANNDTTTSSTSNIFNRYSSLNSLFKSENNDFFNCPDCGHEIPSGKGITTCPSCGLTKEQLAKRTGVSCG